ncbi:MAG: hypothetical protein K6B75_06065 [Lachnospiraceae bacterium]|nr:hypothetical protein [Lachnospiraceae bacterium]
MTEYEEIEQIIKRMYAAGEIDERDYKYKMMRLQEEFGPKPSETKVQVIHAAEDCNNMGSAYKLSKPTIIC